MANSNLKQKIATMATLALTMAPLTGFAITRAEAEANLSQEVYSSVSDNEYVLEGGGTISGKELFDRSQSNGNVVYDVNNRTSELTYKEQQQFATDIVNSANSSVGTNGITTDTVGGLLQRIQTKPGMSTKLMNELMKEGTKPNLVRGWEVVKPFSGPIGTFLGVGAYLIMFTMGLVTVMDVLYIVNPMIRGFADSKKESNGSDSSFFGKYFFSDEATSAVKDAQGGGAGGTNGGSGYKSALWIYLKRRALGMFFLGIVFLYLIMGQLWTGIAAIIDLMSGFLGF